MASVFMEGQQIALIVCTKGPRHFTVTIGLVTSERQVRDKIYTGGLAGPPSPKIYDRSLPLMLSILVFHAVLI